MSAMPANGERRCAARTLHELEDLHSLMKQMRVWLRENPQIHHWNFSDFQDWCDENNDTWSRVLDLKCSWAIKNYMDEQRDNKKVFK